MPSPAERTVDDLIRGLQPRRAIDACSAVLLPFARGAIDWTGFERHLRRTSDAGITPAVNMDTGFGPQLSAEERREVLRRSRAVLGPDRRLIAGAGLFGVTGDPVAGYRAAIADIADVGGMPIIFQSPWLSGQRDGALADAYRAILADSPPALGFELGTMFAPFGRIYTLDEYERLLDVEALVGAKHSSLDRDLELDRLALRDQRRPEFRVYTGNDLAIDLVMYGSDYLLGLSTLDPAAFAQRDAWWRDGDPRFYTLNDALQALGAVAFRAPVPAYKSSAAVYLGLTGQLDGAPEVHPECPVRPAWEADILRPLAEGIARASGVKS